MYVIYEYVGVWRLLRSHRVEYKPSHMPLSQPRGGRKVIFSLMLEGRKHNY